MDTKKELGGGGGNNKNARAWTGPSDNKKAKLVGYFIHFSVMKGEFFFNIWMQ